MTLAKTIAIGAAVLGLAAGGALAGEGDFGMNDRSSGEPAVQPETIILLEPVDVVAYDVYGIDEDRDGVIDGYLFIEESDTLA
jgi:hypothetical protein